MTAPVAAAPSRPGADADQTFPKLTSAQIERVAAHGRTRRIERGEVLGAVGKLTPRFFVVSTGTIEAVQPTCDWRHFHRRLTGRQLNHANRY